MSTHQALECHHFLFQPMINQKRYEHSHTMENCFKKLICIVVSMYIHFFPLLSTIKIQKHALGKIFNLHKTLLTKFILLRVQTFQLV